MEKVKDIKNIISSNKDELENKTVSTQPAPHAPESTKNNAPSMQAFNVRGAPASIPDKANVQQEGDKASRDAKAQEWNQH
jgi:hypothetical protein